VSRHVTDSAPPAVLEVLADGASVSGRELGARLGLTRAAVWKQVARLRELGLPVHAATGAGYRLETPFEALDAEAIRTALPTAVRDRIGTFRVHWQIDSTSSELRRLEAADPHAVAVCMAEVQQAGRGRRGRGWRMPLGGGLALSLRRRFDGGMAALAGLSLAVGVATCEALASSGADRVGLKWPNDLVANGAKLGGILVEVHGDALGPCDAVIGIGLNLRLPDATRAAIDQPVTDLARLGATLPRNLVAARVIAALVPALDRFADDGFAAFAEAYARHDALAGRSVQVIDGDRRCAGIARGVDSRGALRVAFADGERAIESGEVSIRSTAWTS